MNLEASIRAIVNEELDRRDQKGNFIDVDTFCKEKNISRTSLWRARKSGQLQTLNIGKRVFINLDQFTGK